MYTTWTPGSWLVERLFIGTLLERNTVICSCPTLRHLVRSALHLDVLMELIHQCSLLRDVTCYIRDLSRYMYVTIQDGWAWLIGISGSGGSVVDIGHEIWARTDQICWKMGWTNPDSIASQSVKLISSIWAKSGLGSNNRFDWTGLG